MEKLRIGILVDDLQLPKFQAEILRELARSPWCEMALVVRKQKRREPYTGSGYRFYRLLKRLDEKLFGKSTPYLQHEPIDTLCAGSEILEIETGESDFFDTLDRESIEAIRSHAPDLLLNLGFKYLTGEILDVARYGIWEYRHMHRPAAFWEVIRNDPYTQVTLERIGSGVKPGYLLGRYRTVTHPKSMRKNYEQISWRSHLLVVQQLKQLAEAGERYFEDKEVLTRFYDLAPVEGRVKKRFFDLQFHFSDDSGREAPTNCESIAALGRLLTKYAKFTFRRFFKMDRWMILFAKNRAGEVNPNLAEYTRLPLPSNDYFQADPFIVDEGEESYLFYEELDYATLKGYLLVARYDALKETFVDPQEILRKDYHLSYPNVFHYEGEWYMIPETHENGTVDLYQAEQFPTKWRKVRTMLGDIKAVDATLYHKEGKWWMFVGVAPKEGFSLNDELHLYFCDDFRTDAWQPHPCNPVVTDVTCARPAGHLIESEGRLFRPGQNCSGVYGRGLVMNEIVELSETGYRERVAQQIRADFAEDLVAVHTFNRSEHFSVIDVIKSR